MNKKRKISTPEALVVRASDAFGDRHIGKCPQSISNALTVNKCPVYVWVVRGTGVQNSRTGTDG